MSNKDRSSLMYVLSSVLGAILMAASVLLNVGCSAHDRNEMSAGGWVKVDARAFSVLAPPGWKFLREQGIDSYVGRFEGNGVVLKFDYGPYSDSLSEAVEPEYVVSHETIGRYRAKVVYPRIPGRGVTGIYFPEIIKAHSVTGNPVHDLIVSQKLCLRGQDLSGTQQELALRIFRTIRFP